MSLEDYEDYDIIDYLSYNGYYVTKKSDGNGDSTIDQIYQAKRNGQPYEQLLDKLIFEMTERIV